MNYRELGPQELVQEGDILRLTEESSGPFESDLEPSWRGELVGKVTRAFEKLQTRSVNFTASILRPISGQSYPEETNGTRIAAEARKECNSMNTEQRASALQEGMAIISGQSASEQPPEVFCFTCLSDSNPGHFLRGKQTHPRLDQTPWGRSIDGGVLRNEPATNDNSIPDGKYVTAHKDGWTAVSFWDRSGDSRGASNTAFLIAKEISGEELLKLASQQWSEIFNRPGFPIKLSGSCDQKKGESENEIRTQPAAPEPVSEPPAFVDNDVVLVSREKYEDALEELSKLRQELEDLKLAKSAAEVERDAHKERVAKLEEALRTAAGLLSYVKSEDDFGTECQMYTAHIDALLKGQQ